MSKLFTGRLGRLSYLLFTLYFAGGSITILLLMWLFVVTHIQVLAAICYIVFYLYLLIAYIAFMGAAIRRNHDMGITGWASLVIFVPGLNFAYLIALHIVPTSPTANIYGPAHSGSLSLRSVLGL